MEMFFSVLGIIQVLLLYKYRYLFIFVIVKKTIQMPSEHKDSCTHLVYYYLYQGVYIQPNLTNNMVYYNQHLFRNKSLELSSDLCDIVCLGHMPVQDN